ncbi:MAG: ABC transporter permease, partial [Bryobacteraceae bacterium]|nr:ABC transporter permease [Bryobacteraceae bacterium]
AVLGAGLAQVLSRGLVAFLTTANSPLFVGLGIDFRVLGFTSLLAVFTCVLFGLLPALRATQITPASAMRAGGRGTTAGRERFGLRRVLVATQVALSLVLLVGALLFTGSFRNLMTTDAGFQAEGVLAVQLDLSTQKYGTERIRVVHQELLRKLTARPGVVSAAQVFFTPVSNSGWNNSIGPDGSVAATSGKESQFNRVGPGYFKTLGTPLLAGRDFTDRDNASSPKVAIVNEVFAKKFFNGANPVGRSFNLEAEAGKPEKLYQIVGLVKNTKYYELREDFMPVGFFPVAEDEEPGAGATYVLRTAGGAGSLMSHVKAAVAEVSPGIGVEFRFLSQQLKESVLREQLMATLSGGFGFLAALLATLGLYGVIAYMVARRRNEIGVRMALGADRGSVVRLVLREAALLLAVGLAVGAVLSIWAATAASTLLFGLKPNDPGTLVAAMALLATVALAASYAPARRAAGMDPMTALRDE